MAVVLVTLRIVLLRVSGTERACDVPSNLRRHKATTFSANFEVATRKVSIGVDLVDRILNRAFCCLRDVLHIPCFVLQMLGIAV